MVIKALLADDEALSRANIRALLRPYSDWQVVAECDTGDAVLETLKATPVDVVFLDIQMPGKSGMRTAAELAAFAKPPLIVFVTAFQQYAVDAFEVAALDYLLKPIHDERFAETISRLEAGLESREALAYPERLAHWQQHISDAEDDTRDHPLQRVVVRSVGKFEFVEIADLRWVRSAGNYIELHLQERTLLHRASMNYFDRHLDPVLFQRVHRTAIVRLSEIRALHTTASGSYELLLINGDKVPVSNRYRDTLQQRLGLQEA